MGNTILTSILSMAGLGLFFASVLALASQKLKVKEDPKVKEIESALPGLNCGACGFTSCHLYAEALAKNEKPPDECKAGGEEAACRLSGILGIEIGKKIKELAIVHCGADETKRKKKANYLGIKTCQAVHNMRGGEVLCEYGCLGYGDCMKACPFGAIRISDGLPRIDKDKCTACGKCVIACPRSIISVEKIESQDFLYVACSSREKGADTRKTCPVGCIGCGICQRLTEGIFSVENNLASAKSEKMNDINNKEEVIKKCPTKCINRS